jgi:transcription antitermination protein NusB
MSMAARRKARILICQALYQWQITKDDETLIQKQFLEENVGKNYEESYFSQVFLNIVSQAEKIDSLLMPFLVDRILAELTPIELAVLRIGTYEMINQADIPFAVSITEAIRLSKRFGATDGYKFVNAVLDKVAVHLQASKSK